MFLTIIISSVCVFLTYVLVCRHYLPPTNEQVPTCPGKLPIIGHSYMLNIEKMFQSLISFGDYSLRVGGVSKIFIGPMPIYIVTDPEDVTTVLNKCLKKMFVYKFVQPMLGKTLVAAEVPTWKRNRRILDLCFKQYLLDDYLELFNVQAGRFVELLAQEVGQREVDLTEKITKSVLETACREFEKVFYAMQREIAKELFSDKLIVKIMVKWNEMRTTLGARLDGKDLVKDNYIVAINECLDILTTRVYKPWLIFDFTFNLSSYKNKLSKALETVFSLTEEMVLLMKSEHLKRLTNEEDFDYEGRKFQSALDVIMENTVTENSSIFSDTELRNMVDNLLLAAFDTTIYEMLFVFICIGSYPEVQGKVYQEIKQVLGKDGKVSREHLSQLIYLEAVIKESIRLYPIALIVGRETTIDTKLRNVTIPTGSSILVHLWSINRNTKYWGQDAEEFKPERWLTSDTVPGHQAAYASFSPGRRGCIGKTYALMYLKATVIPLIRKYKLTADHTKMKLECKIMIKPISGHLVKIEQRQFNK